MTEAPPLMKSRCSSGCCKPFVGEGSRLLIIGLSWVYPATAFAHGTEVIGSAMVHGGVTAFAALAMLVVFGRPWWLRFALLLMLGCVELLVFLLVHGGVFAYDHLLLAMGASAVAPVLTFVTGVRVQPRLLRAQQGSRSPSLPPASNPAGPRARNGRPPVKQSAPESFE